MTTRMKTLLLSATAAFALAACGGDEDDNSASTAKVEAIEAKEGSKSPLDKPFKLANAEPVDIEAMVSGMGATYDSAEFDKNLGATVITNFRPEGDDNEMIKIGRLELYGLDTDAAAALNSGEGLAEMTELFTKIRAYDVNGSFPVDGEITAAMGGGEDIGGAVGTMTIAALEIDTLKMKSMQTDNGEQKDVQFGGMAMKDFAMAVPFSDEGHGLKMSAPDFRLGSYSNGVFGGFFAEDFAYSIKQSEEMINAQLEDMGPQAAGIFSNPVLRNLAFPAEQTVTVGSMKWDGLTITNLLPYLSNDETPPVTETDLIKVGGMEFLDQDVMVNGQKLGTTKRTVMDAIEFHHFMPKKIRIVSEGSKADMTVLAAGSEELAGILKNNGLDNVTGESSFLYTFDPKSGAINLDADGEADGFYGLKLDLALSEFDYDAIVGGLEDGSGQAALMNAALNGLSLEIKDEKLLDTLFAIAGNVTEQDPTALRQQAVGLLSIGAIQGAQISPRIPEYVTALSSFISEGGTLKISAAPEAPVTFGGLAAAGSQGDPAAVLDTVNLTVTRD